jgi:cell division protein FtsL
MSAVDIILLIAVLTLGVVLYTQYLTQQAIMDLDRRIREGDPGVGRELTELNARMHRLERTVIPDLAERGR